MMPWIAAKYHQWRWESAGGEGWINISGRTTTGCYLSNESEDDRSDALAAE